MDFTYGPEHLGDGSDSRLALPALPAPPKTGPKSRNEWGLLTAIKDCFEFESITLLFREWRAMTPAERLELRVLLIRAGYNIPEGSPLISKEESEELRKSRAIRFHRAEDDGPNHEMNALYAEQQADLIAAFAETVVFSIPKVLPPITVDSGYRLGDVHPSMMASSPKE